MASWITGYQCGRVMTPVMGRGGFHAAETARRMPSSSAASDVTAWRGHGADFPKLVHSWTSSNLRFKRDHPVKIAYICLPEQQISRV